MEQTLDTRPVDWRELPLVRYLVRNRAVLLLALMVLLAVGSRFWDLGSRALHHDESLHAVYSFYLYDKGEYRHDPLMHGPILFHLTALGYWLFGVSDYTARIVPAILGVILVWIPWKFRAWLGIKGALVASALILVSPTLLYYSRFIREDIFAVMWTVIIVYGLWRYMERGEDFHLYLMTAGWALLFSQKEISFLLAFIFWTFLALVLLLRVSGRLGGVGEVRDAREWHLLVLLGALLLPHASALVLHLIGMDPAQGYNATAYQDWHFLRQAGSVTLLLFLLGLGAAAMLWDLRRFLIAAGIFYTIFILFHTTFLTSPAGVGSGMVGALGYWIEQHEVQRGGQPWYYYLLLLPLYEFLPLLAGLFGGIILLLRGQKDTLVREEVVTVEGSVQAVADPRALSLRTDSDEGEEWLVLAPPGVPSFNNKLQEQSIEVTGTVVRFRRADLSRQLGIKLPKDLYLAYEGKPALLATAVRPLDRAGGRNGSGTTREQEPGQSGKNGSDPAAPRHPLVGRLHLDARALWPFFNLWWFGMAFFIFSYAGEKMPWLLCHIAFPLILLAGWAMDRFLDGVEWEHLWRREALLAALCSALLSIAAPLLLWMGLSSEWPFQGTEMVALQRTSRWLGSLLLVGLAAWGLFRLRPRLGGRAVRHLSLMTLFALLLLISVRFAWIASFRNGDVPNEPLIYTQTSPQVPMVMREIETISRRLTGGKELEIAYDSSTLWPFHWYLRDYPNKFYFGSNPGNYVDRIQAASVVLVGLDQENLVRDMLNGYIRHHYSMRPNFPEDYKKLTQTENYQSEPNNLLNILGNIWELAQQPQARSDFLHFLWNREVRGELGRYDFVVYVKPEVAKEVWQYGLTVATMDPDLLKDPYAEAVVPLQPAASLTTAGLVNPKDVALLPDGRLVVADGGNHRLVVLAPDGTVEREIGGQGSAPGQFNEPWGVAAAPDGTIYVADTWNHRIQHLTVEGEVLHHWGGELSTNGELGPSGLFWGPRDVAVDGEGRVYVTDTGNKRVQVFEADGSFVGQFGGAGSAPGQLAEPVGITVAEDGTIWVADTWNRRIQSFAPDFTPLSQLPVRAWSGQNIANKPYIAASADRLWISDPEQYRIIEFDHAGSVQRVWGGFTGGGSALNLPLGLAFDGGRLWVVDSGNHHLQAYDVGQPAGEGEE